MDKKKKHSYSNLKLTANGFSSGSANGLLSKSAIFYNIYHVTIARLVLILLLVSVTLNIWITDTMNCNHTHGMS